MLGARACGSNNGASWADHVLPVFEGLGVKRTDIVVGPTLASEGSVCSA